MKYKEQYPAAMITTEKIWAQIERHEKVVQESLLTVRSVKRKYGMILSVLLILGTLIIFTVTEVVTLSLFILFIFIFWLVVILGIVYYYKFDSARKDLRQEIDSLVFKMVFDLFDISIDRTTVFMGSIVGYVNESLLFTDQSGFLQSNNTIRFQLDGKGCSISEVQVGNFRGWLVCCDINKNLLGRTYVSTEDDKVGFGHITFWNKILGSTEVRETILEWNQFEKKLHVATSDPREAREILDPVFISQLYDWWHSQSSQNIRIVFYADKMIMSFEDPTIKLSSSMRENRISPEALRKNVGSLSLPLRHILNLIAHTLHTVR